jgi:hypothetical protein
MRFRDLQLSQGASTLSAMRALRVVPLVVALLLVRTGWHVLFDDQSLVVDGVLTIGPDDWFITGVGAIGWTVAVLTAIAVLDGGRHPIARAVRALPVALAGLVAYLVPLVGCGFLAGLLLPGEPAVVVFVVAVTAIVLIGVATNLGLSATVAVVERAGFGAFATYAELRGKRWDMGVLFAFGVVAPVVVVALPHRYLRPASVVTGLAVELLFTVLVAGAAVLQAMTLMEIYRRTRIIPELAPRAVSSEWDRTVLIGATVALLLPAAVSGAIASAGRLTEVHHVDRVENPPIAFARPSGRTPVLVTSDGIEDCLDDYCWATRRTDVPPLMTTTSVAIRADGTVALLSGGELTVCDPTRRCTGGRAAGRVEPLAEARAVAVAAPGTGEFVLAKATPVGPDGDRKLTLVRCQDPSCRTGTPVELGVAPGRSSTVRGPEALSVGVDGRGRLFAVYRDGSGQGFLGWCVRPDCSQTRLIQPGQIDSDAPTIDDLLRVPRVAGVPLCSFSACRGLMPAVVAARPGGGYYAVVTEPVGSGELDVRLVLCDDPSCESYVHVATVLRDHRASWTGDPLLFGVSDSGRQDERWMITVGADGLVSLTKPYESPSILITVDPA